MVKRMSERKQKGAILPPDTKVYYKGKWIPASQVPPRRRRKIDIARDQLTKEVIKEILRSPSSSIDRAKLIELAEKVSVQVGLKRRVGYRFLITEGIIGRVRGSREYFLTEKAKELFPELFEEK